MNPSKDHKERIQNYAKSTEAYQALTANQSGPAPVGPRAYLQDNMPESPTQPFTKALSTVNSNLASHSNEGLSQHRAEGYVHRSHNVEADRSSNAFAHAQSAASWATGSDKSATGFGMNVLGALATGVHDHANYKTGKILNKKSNDK